MIYKKLNKYDEEKNYYLKFLQSSDLFFYCKPQYLLISKHLIKREKNWFKRTKLIFRYYFDKNIRHHFLKNYENMEALELDTSDEID